MNLPFLPKTRVSMELVMPPAREEQELKEASSYNDYEEERALRPNTGHVEFANDAAYHESLDWLETTLPLTVPTYTSTKPGSKYVDALTRPHELKVGPPVTVTVMSHSGDNCFEGSFIELWTQQREDADNEMDAVLPEGADTIWKTIGICDGYAKIGPSCETVDDMDEYHYNMYYKDFKHAIPVMVSNMMPGEQSTAISFSDVIRAAQRKRRAEVFELLVPMIMAEKRPCTTKLGTVFRTSPIFDSNVYKLIGSMLM
jgi:hypothetical protein